MFPTHSLIRRHRLRHFLFPEGGDYVVLTKKLHKDSGRKAVDIKKAEKRSQRKRRRRTAILKMADREETPAAGSSGNQPSDKPEKAKFDVTIEIRRDTLAEDLSKLEDPALEAYVPADGTILPTTKSYGRRGNHGFRCAEQSLQR